MRTSGAMTMRDDGRGEGGQAHRPRRTMDGHDEEELLHGGDNDGSRAAAVSVFWPEVEEERSPCSIYRGWTFSPGRSNESGLKTFSPGRSHQPRLKV